MEFRGAAGAEHPQKQPGAVGESTRTNWNLVPCSMVETKFPTAVSLRVGTEKARRQTGDGLACYAISLNF